MPAFAAIVLAFALLALAGGDLTLPRLHALKWRWPILVVFVVQGVARGRLFGGGLGELGLMIWAAASLALILLAWRSASFPGVALVAAGVAANVLVVLINGGMPVAAAIPEGAFYHAIGPADRLVFLADVVPAPGRLMLSVGDILMMLGLLVAVFSAGSPTPLTDRDLRVPHVTE